MPLLGKMPPAMGKYPLIRGECPLIRVILPEGECHLFRVISGWGEWPGQEIEQIEKGMKRAKQSKGRNTSSCPLVPAVFASCQLALQLLQLGIIHLHSKPATGCHSLPYTKSASAATGHHTSSCRSCRVSGQLDVLPA